MVVGDLGIEAIALFVRFFHPWRQAVHGMVSSPRCSCPGIQLRLKDTLHTDLHFIPVPKRKEQSPNEYSPDDESCSETLAVHPSPFFSIQSTFASIGPMST